MDRSKLLVTALSGLMMVGAAHASEGKVHCMGVNACKGKGACKTAENACKGHNSCKGKGVTEVKSEKECTDKKGTVSKG